MKNKVKEIYGSPMQNAASFKRKMQFHVKTFTKKNIEENKYNNKNTKRKENHTSTT